jgi:Glycosyltransferase
MTQKIKTVLIITQLQLGGAQKSVLYTAQHLDDRFEPYLITGPGGYFDKQALSSIKNVIFIDGLRRAINPFNDLPALLQLVLALRKIKPQIVHTNSSKAGILGRIAAKIATKAKIIHTVHGFGFNDKQNFIIRNLYIIAEKFCALFTDTLIFVSQENLNLALKLKIAPKAKCRLVRAGVKLQKREDFSHIDRAQKLACIGLKETDKVILSIANLKPQKNPLDMVKAARIVCDKIPNAVFLYLGEGELRQKTAAMIKKLHLQDNFKLLGHREDTGELLYCSDAFCLSSLWEGLPMALAEALSQGVPAVCYDTDGVKEILSDGKNGYLVKKGDYKNLAAGLINVLEGKLKFDAAAADLKEFDIDLMVKKQQEIYLGRSI